MTLSTSQQQRQIGWRWGVGMALLLLLLLVGATHAAPAQQQGTPLGHYFLFASDSTTIRIVPRQQGALPDLSTAQVIPSTPVCPNRLTGLLPLNEGLGDFIALWGDGSEDSTGDCYARFVRQADGSFTQTSSGVWPATWRLGASPADLDQDGRDDLFIVQSSNSGFHDLHYKVARGLPDGTFDFNFYASPVLLLQNNWFHAQSLADINGDGQIDLLYHNSTTGGSFTTHLYTLAGRGDGTFAPVSARQLLLTAPGSTAPAVADFNGDGVLDIHLPPDDDVADLGQSQIAFGTNPGFAVTPSVDFRPTIERGTSDEYWAWTSPCDADLDGTADLLVWEDEIWNRNLSHGSVYLNNGSGTFTAGLILDPGIGLACSPGVTTPHLYVDPEASSVTVRDTQTVTLRLANISNISTVDVRLQFDPALVRVVGMVPGSCPSADFVLINTVDNSLGRLRYVATSLSPTPPCEGGGSVLEVVFEGVRGGESPITLLQTQIADPDGTLIPITLGEGSIEVRPRLYVDPELSSLYIGDVQTVTLALEGVSDLTALDVRLSFDPSLVQALSLTPGSCPNPAVVLMDTINNQSGLVRYAAGTLPPIPPCSGDGPVAQVSFQALETGISPLTFVEAELANGDGMLMPVTTENGSIEVLANGTVEGVVELQGRTNHQGATVTAEVDGVTIATTTTDATGAYSLSLRPGDAYSLTVSIESYLGAESRTLLDVVGGETLTLPTVRLLGGDVSDPADNMVNIADLTLIGAELNNPVPPGPARADITGDGQIDISDLAIAAGNFEMSGPILWP